MSTLENQVQEIEGLFASESFRELSLAGCPAVPASGSAGLILESETAATLGGPGLASARLLLYSNVASSGAKDTVRLLGEDLASLDRPAPFAQAVVLRGKSVTAETFYQFMQRHKRLLDQPGFMVKSMKTDVWCRADKERAAGGLAPLSAGFISRIRAAFPEVEAVEVWWVTGHGELVEKLAALSQQSEDTLTAIKAGVWKDRGFDYKSCQLAGHCGECGDKKTCASVRQMEAKVKLKRRREAAAATAA